MKLVSLTLLLLGYTLVYAAVATGVNAKGESVKGIFATDPWEGLFRDAYTETGPSGAEQRKKQQEKGEGLFQYLNPFNLESWGKLPSLGETLKELEP